MAELFEHGSGFSYTSISRDAAQLLFSLPSAVQRVQKQPVGTLSKAHLHKFVFTGSTVLTLL